MRTQGAIGCLFLFTAIGGLLMLSGPPAGRSALASKTAESAACDPLRKKVTALNVPLEKREYEAAGIAFQEIHSAALRANCIDVSGRALWGLGQTQVLRR